MIKWKHEFDDDNVDHKDIDAVVKTYDYFVHDEDAIHEATIDLVEFESYGGCPDSFIIDHLNFRYDFDEKTSKMMISRLRGYIEHLPEKPKTFLIKA